MTYPGYDAGKTIKGRKRHLAVDTNGNPRVAQVHPANVQDRDGAVPRLQTLHTHRQTVRVACADRAYGGPKLAPALQEAECPIAVEVVKKGKDDKGVVRLPRRWWSSARSDGGAAAGASRRISSAPSPAPGPGSGWP